MSFLKIALFMSAERSSLQTNLRVGTAALNRAGRECQLNVRRSLSQHWHPMTPGSVGQATGGSFDLRRILTFIISATIHIFGATNGSRLKLIIGNSHVRNEPERESAHSNGPTQTNKQTNQACPIFDKGLCSFRFFFRPRLCKLRQARAIPGDASPDIEQQIEHIGGLLEIYDTDLDREPSKLGTSRPWACLEEISAGNGEIGKFVVVKLHTLGGAM
ncbi:hypothetical protein B0H11DRAFT_1928387 [Mycena galericulata]|nr:hypothetical protein B0H11DRAFT_1928387 [Mycena galericulata]